MLRARPCAAALWAGPAIARMSLASPYQPLSHFVELFAHEQRAPAWNFGAEESTPYLNSASDTLKTELTLIPGRCERPLLMHSRVAIDLTHSVVSSRFHPHSFIRRFASLVGLVYSLPYHARRSAFWLSLPEGGEMAIAQYGE